ncbi:hypothetical protein HK099_001640, partial [Clydaea vesicula]
ENEKGYLNNYTSIEELNIAKIEVPGERISLSDKNSTEYLKTGKVLRLLKNEDEFQTSFKFVSKENLIVPQRKTSAGKILK